MFNTELQTKEHRALTKTQFGKASVNREEMEEQLEITPNPTFSNRHGVADFDMTNHDELDVLLVLRAEGSLRIGRRNIPNDRRPQIPVHLEFEELAELRGRIS